MFARSLALSSLLLLAFACDGGRPVGAQEGGSSGAGEAGALPPPEGTGGTLGSGGNPGSGGTPRPSGFDGGIIHIPDGGEILLDPSCPIAQPQIFDTEYCSILLGCAHASFPLWGCCLPNGKCGAATPEPPAAGANLVGSVIPPQECATYAGLVPYPFFAVVPPDPEQSCNYTLGTTSNGGAEAGDAARDASLDDARVHD